MTAILDTSFLLALTDTSDSNHARVLGVSRALTDSLVLPVTVLPEICYLLASRLGHSAMRRFLQELTTSRVLLEPLVLTDLPRVVELLNQYADSRLDFVDATLITIAERRNITRVLSLDRRDYSIVRPRHCGYFEILP